MLKKSKKLILIGMLATGLVTFWGHWTEAPAPQWPSFGGWNLNPGSLHATQLVSHLRNVDNNPVIVEVRLTNLYASFRCINNGGQSETAQGEAHWWDGVITGSQALTSENITKNGRALSEIIFSDLDIFNGLFCTDDPPPGPGEECTEYDFGEDVCVNPNWTPLIPGPGDDGLITVEQTDALGLLWWDHDGDLAGLDGSAIPGGTPMILADFQANRCWLNAAGTGYDCDECDGVSPHPNDGNIGDVGDDLIIGQSYSPFGAGFTWDGCIPAQFPYPSP